MSTSVASVRRFDYGSLFTSATVFDASCEHIPFGEFVRSCIARHLYGLDSKIWIITESSREYTTVIFPSEY